MTGKGLIGPDEIMESMLKLFDLVTFALLPLPEPALGGLAATPNGDALAAALNAK